MLIEKCRYELENHILPFWNELEDKERGGFYGYVGFDLTLDKDADKGVILNSRILWFYSSCYNTIGGEENLRLAAHAYEFLRDYCYDKEFGGVYWMMKCDGSVSDSMKHTYNQAFAIYALSEYYLASKNREALNLAFDIFSTIEEKALDEYGYMEAFSREWELIENDALSENGLMADKTMNTILHLIEGYIVLYKASGDEVVAQRLKFLLSQMSDKVFDPERNALKVFFDTTLSVIGDIHSYGHDIEATWLMDRACETLGDRELTEKFREMNLKISNNILNIALEGGALNNERENDKIDRKRVWWVQAEAVVGFVNAYQKSGDEKFLDAARTVMTYITEQQIDKRCGEWYAEITFEGVPHDFKETVGPWKCPYHNGRMCLEMISRNVVNA